MVFMEGGVNMGYGGSCGGGCGFGGGFALLVVLFILLIIVGASCWGGGFGRKEEALLRVCLFGMWLVYIFKKFPF